MRSRHYIIGGLARFDFISGDRSSFTIHVSNELCRFTGQNLSNADDLYKEHLGEMLSPPSGESLEKLPPFVRHEFSIKKAKTDIVISGLRLDYDSASGRSRRCSCTSWG